MSREPSRLPAVHTDTPLRGREAELAALVGALADAKDGSAACIALTGAAGLGKSRLLDEMRGLAADDGFAISGTTGHEVHQDLIFAGLASVVRPLLDHLEEIPEREASTLRGALGLDAEPTSALAVANATLALLAQVAERQPLLVAVDDAHWVDQSSLTTLLFVGHQLQAERIALVFAARPAPSSVLARADLQTIELADLDHTSAEEVIQDQGAPPTVARRCRELAGGNPLALIEGYRGLSPDQRSGRAEMPTMLAMGDRLLEALTHRLATLPQATADALTIVAADVNGRLDVVTRAIASRGGHPDDLLQAEADAIIDLESNHITWRHPLLCAAVRMNSTSAQWRDAHQALASVLPPTDEQRVIHLAQSSIGHDDAVALELERSGHDAVRRGALVSAAALFRSAANLSSVHADAHRLRVEAARHLYLAGDLESVAQVVQQQLETTEDDVEAAELVEVLGQADMWLRGPTAASHVLEEYALLVASRAPELTVTLHLRAALASLIALDPDRAVGQADAALAIAERADVSELVLVAWAIRTVLDSFCDSPVSSSDVVETLRTIQRAAMSNLLRPQADAAVHLSSYALTIVDQPEAALEGLDELVRYTRTTGRTGVSVVTRVMRAEALWRQGRWLEALAEVDLAVSLQAASGARELVPAVRAVEARLLAVLGRADECEAVVDLAVSSGGELGLNLALVWAHGARGLLHLGSGRWDSAARALEQVAGIAGHLRQPGFVWWRGDFIEALHGAAQRDDALVALDQLETITRSDSATWAGGIVARSRALLDVDDAEGAYATALEAFTALGYPFERARTLLLRGRHRLRGRDASAGHRDLAEARSAFDRLGAREWAVRAAVAGEEAATVRRSLASALTGKELPVALIVGGGATDREAANELYISVKTVSYHLTNIYAKLAIRNRTELAAIVAAEHAASAI